jgi:hypothetical protein
MDGAQANLSLETPKKEPRTARGHFVTCPRIKWSIGAVPEIPDFRVFGVWRVFRGNPGFPGFFLGFPEILDEI